MFLYTYSDPNTGECVDQFVYRHDASAEYFLGAIRLGLVLTVTEEG